MKNYSLSVLERKHWVIFAAVIVISGWLALAMYSLSVSKSNNGMLSPEEIATKAVKTTPSESTPSAPPVERKGINPKVVADKGMTMPTTSSSPLPQAQMTSTSMHIRSTSDATAHVIGSGMGHETGTSSASSGQRRGIAYSGLGFGGNMLAMSSSLVLAAPGNGYANDIASTTMSERNAAPKVRKVSEDPLDPFLDPVGDVTWGLMALLTIGYGVIVRRRKQQACK